MDKRQASSIIEKIFNSSFNRETFIDFIGNLFNLNSNRLICQNINIYDSYKQAINSLEVVAQYSDGRNSVDILIVTLMRDTSLDRARTMQRNFVARYLSEKQGDAAVVAFHSPNARDWRFSLIKMEYKLSQTKTGFKFEQEINKNLSSKRWSFLVGKNERSHTAQNQLVSILANDLESPLLDDLEQAFNIETVTKEFFDEYSDLYLRMKDSLDAILENDDKLKSEFEVKEISTSDFAKKTMGQMAFMYFLQKKGWFGVAPNKEWGTGVKNFLREVFERREKYGENFFDDVLEPLFYEALAQDRGNKSIYPKLNNCRIPFLNGGLFDPMNGYSWETTHIRLPDDLFSNNNRTKKGDIGDGILDIFDRYNFTVNETDPLEMEVAVDPEMLGKVFENLLEIKDRKSKGSYYTPREIVHFMCQESLINFLITETNDLIPKSDIEFFIRQSSQIIQYDKAVTDSGEQMENLQYMLPKSIIDQSSILDDLLMNIKVCDPAVGSGAFPLGMLNEIVCARKILGIHLRTKYTNYNLKLHAISNSIYGVDIDPGAIEIAKLRFWLSLVVEEDSPTPLPNLEHKIMQGNSLISQYAGIELFNDNFINSNVSVNTEKKEIKNKINKLQSEYFSLHSSDELTSIKKKEFEKEIRWLQRRFKLLDNTDYDVDETVNLFDEDGSNKIAQQKLKSLQKKTAEYVNVVGKTDKENLKKEIDFLKWELIESNLVERGEMDKLGEIKKLRKKNIKPFFIWKLEFSDVFRDKNGFDIVIGNPPYKKITVNNTNADELDYYLNNYSSIKNMPSKNIYTLFIERGISLSKNSTSYIVPEGLFKTRSYKSCVDIINHVCRINFITYFRKMVFENAVTGNLIFLLTSKEVNNVGRIKTKEYIFDDNSNLKELTRVENPIISKISSSHFPKLDMICNTFKGMVVQKYKSFITETNETKKDIFLIGRSISNWVINTVYYAKYEELKIIGGTKNKEKHDTVPRILIRRTGDTLVTALLESPALTESTLYSCWSRSNNYETKYIFALLNSSIYKYYVKEKIVTNEQAYPQILLSDIKSLPIPDIKLIDQKIFISLVDKILDAKRTDSKSNVNQLEKQIDELVFDLFQLSSDEQQLVLNSS